MLDDEPLTHIFSLETPGLQELEPGARHRFSGFALGLRGRRMETLLVQSGSREIGSFPVSEPSPDVQAYLPRREGAADCRFRFELDVPRPARDLVFWGRERAGPPTRLLAVPLERAWIERRRLRRIARQLSRIPVPGSDLISLTQGGGDPQAYLRSIIGGLWSLEQYLAAAKIRRENLTKVLDFGCGTGRLLLSWWMNGRRDLWGCDVNPLLIRWNEAHLPRRIRVIENRLDPPLALPEQSFDLIQAVSVFTHVSLERQRLWLKEFLRLLKPGGVLLLTLHGPIYAELFGGDEDGTKLEREGYLECRYGPEGSTRFATFHARWFGQELLSELRDVTTFPYGRIDGEGLPSPLAMLQDVYLARKAQGT